METYNPILVLAHDATRIVIMKQLDLFRNTVHVNFTILTISWNLDLLSFFLSSWAKHFSKFDTEWYKLYRIMYTEVMITFIEEWY